MAHPMVPGAYVLNLVPPSSDLRNEETWALEAGYTARLDESLTVTANSYYQRFEDMIGFQTLPDGLGFGRIIFSPDNVDGADSFGAELEMAWKCKQGEVSAWYAYNDFEPDQGNQQLRAFLPAKHKTGITGRLFLPKSITLNANYKFNTVTSGKHANPLNPVNPGSTHRMDLTVSKEISEGAGEIMLGVSNLFNQTNDAVPGVGMLTLHETPGRTFFGRVQIRF